MPEPLTSASESCYVCGRSQDACICPTCKTCGKKGSPPCYAEHGLVITKEQMDGRERLGILLEEDVVQDDPWMESQTGSAG